MRRHVFPVCGPGSKTISFEGLEVELNHVDSTPSAESYTNKDKSIALRKYTKPDLPDTNMIIQVIVSRGQYSSDNQVLIDLNDSDFPSDLLDSIGAIPNEGGYPYRGVRGSVIYSMTPESNDAYAPSTIIPYVPTPLAPGTVMCVATKNFGGSLQNDFVYHGLGAWSDQLYPGTEENPYGSMLFWDIYPGSTDLSSFNVDTNRGEWFTVMFTGTRWVLLGSNNWY